MSIKFTIPANLAYLKLGDPVRFQGISDNGVVKVELLADDKFKLGEVTITEGAWYLNYVFNTAGKRRIVANGFDDDGKKLISDTIDIFIIDSIGSDQGIDVSNLNGKSVDWEAVKNSNISFAFAKASEGITYVDDAFVINWKGMKNAGIICGAYHFFRPLKHPKQQAENFLKQVKDVLEAGDLAPVLDVEHYPEKVEREWQQINLNQRIDCVLEWLETVEQATGLKPLIYTSPGFWRQYMNDSQDFTKYPLWLAHYITKPHPEVPAHNWGGKGWTFWQYTENGSVAGVKGEVDRNRFNGSFAQLVAFANGSLIA